MGAAYDELHRHDLAQTYYRRALTLEPKSADIVYNMAISRKLAGNSDASGWLAKAAALDPNYGAVRAVADTTQTDTVSQRLASSAVDRPDPDDVERTRPKIQRASVIEYELVLPEQRPIDLGRAIAPGRALNVVPVRPRATVPPLESVTGKASASTPAKVTTFDPSLLACAPNVSPGTLNAIIHTESGGNPLALHVNGSDQQPPPARDAAEAARFAASYVERGYSVDVGLMQVNSRNLVATGHTLQQAPDPCTNILHGSTILTDNYTSAARTRGNESDALLAALSAYNTGDFRRGFTNGYVAHVISSSTNAAGPRLPPPPVAGPQVPTVKPLTRVRNPDADMARLTLAIDLIEQRLITAKLDAGDASKNRLAMR